MLTRNHDQIPDDLQEKVEVPSAVRPFILRAPSRDWGIGRTNIRESGEVLTRTKDREVLVHVSSLSAMGQRGKFSYQYVYGDV